MDQQKIGLFLKELRKGKGITQEQLADKFSVSSRTVSRWENGINMPDLDILIDISDFYEVDLRDILNGEKKKQESQEDVNGSILQAVNYSNIEAEKYNKRIFICEIIAVVLIVLAVMLKDASIYSINPLMQNLVSLTEGLGVGLMIAGLLMTSRYGKKLNNLKKRILDKTKQ